MTHAAQSSPRIGLEVTLENINNQQCFLTFQTQPQSNIVSAVNNAHLWGEDIRGGLRTLEPFLVRLLCLCELQERFISPLSLWQESCVLN